MSGGRSMKLVITVRPLRPEWDIKSEHLDLDSLSKTHVIDLNPSQVFSYLKGWNDAGFIIIALDELKGGN